MFCAGKTTVCNDLHQRGHHAIHGDEALASWGNLKLGGRGWTSGAHSVADHRVHWLHAYLDDPQPVARAGDDHECAWSSDQPAPIATRWAYRLWKTASPAYIQTILGPSRVGTTLKYRKPTEDDRRAALEDTNRVRGGVRRS